MKTSISNILRQAVALSLALSVASVGLSLYAQSDKTAPSQSSSSVDGTIEYVVAKGDTLYGLGRKFGVSVADICTANSITKEQGLKAGQKLVIPLTASSYSKPAAETVSDNTKTERTYDVYTVQKGDTFWHIAQINDMSVDELKSLNNLTKESTLKVGQKLKIPATIVDTSKAELPDLPSADPRTYTEKKVDPNLVWPVKTPAVTYVTGKVKGVQLTASKNEAVTAIRAGTVTSCGNYRGFGQVVFVLSKTGLVYAYSGLGSVKVTRGQYVVFGDVIGTAGTDSIKGTPQIMFMVYQKGTAMDPAKAPRG